MNKRNDLFDRLNVRNLPGPEVCPRHRACSGARVGLNAVGRPEVEG